MNQDDFLPTPKPDLELDLFSETTILLEQNKQNDEQLQAE